MWATTIKVKLESSLDLDSLTTHDGEGAVWDSLVSSHMTAGSAFVRGSEPHGNEHPVAVSGYPGLYPGLRILPTRPATSHKPRKSAVAGMKTTTRNPITIVCGGYSYNVFTVK